MSTDRRPERISLIKRLVVGARPKVTLVRMAILGLFCGLFFSFVLRPVFVDGVSMYPTLQDGGFLFANLMAYRSEEPKRGDIVVIEIDGFSAMYLKRVLGLPGESIGFNSGTLQIDGELFEEPYLASKGDWNMKKVTLGPDEYLVAGDNRDISRKKHLMGTVERRKIRGKILKK